MRKVFIIAEAGVNHNGSVETALSMIEAAHACGADAVKFQTFRSEDLVTHQAPKAKYQIENTSSSETQLEMLKKLELSAESHFQLKRHAEKIGITFLSTPFESHSLQFLAKELKVSLLKISSGEITNAPFLLEAARTQLPIILSTGMSSLEEVEQALKIIAFGYGEPTQNPTPQLFSEPWSSRAQQVLSNKNFILLHCTSEYPAPVNEVNLLAMDTMANYFNLPVGLSDHTEGIHIALAAVARGATVIEKHFTLDKSLSGPDHKASLEPKELLSLVKNIRDVESALGISEKTVSPSENKNRLLVRKGLVASIKIKQGDVFSSSNLTMKRPASGVSPLHYWEQLGKIASQDYEKNDPIVK